MVHLLYQSTHYRPPISTGSLGSLNSELTSDPSFIVAFLNEAGTRPEHVREVCNFGFFFSCGSLTFRWFIQARALFREACSALPNQRTQELFMDEFGLTQVLVKLGISHRYGRQVLRRVFFYALMLILLPLVSQIV